MFRTDNSVLVVSNKDSMIAKMKLQLSYDNLTQVKFFKIILDAYLNRDERLMSLIQENTIGGKTLKRMTDKKHAKQTINDFALEENEVENIFDIIEKENSDL